MPTNPLTPHSILTRTPDVVAAPLENDLALMRLDSNAYYCLDGVGRRIWEQLEQPRTLAQVCQALTEIYAVAPDECERDVVRFLEELRREGLVHVAAPAG